MNRSNGEFLAEIFDIPKTRPNLPASLNITTRTYFDVPRAPLSENWRRAQAIDVKLQRPCNIRVYKASLAKHCHLAATFMMPVWVVKQRHLARPFQAHARLVSIIWIFAASSITILATASIARADDFIIGPAEAAPNPQPEYPRPISFHIPETTLQAALETFSAQSGVQTLYQAAITQGRISHPIDGSLEPLEALQTLLQGTGLVPIEIFNGGFTIAPAQQAASNSPTSTMIARLDAPFLPLKTIHVQAPSEEERRLYARSVQYAIQSALLRDRDTRNTPYSADVFVWVTSTGSIQHASLFASTGSATMDVAIANVVRSVQVGQSPPSGLPQPMHVRILTQNAQH
jgi:hypothetical protein